MMTSGMHRRPFEGLHLVSYFTFFVDVAFDLRKDPIKVLPLPKVAVQGLHLYHASDDNVDKIKPITEALGDRR